jgi:hypothetical protein
MVKIEVYPPQKSDDLYKFEYRISDSKKVDIENFQQRLKAKIRVLRGKKPKGKSKSPVEQGGSCYFGFKAVNFNIQHSDIWDSVYPLMYLTRNGGPIYGKYDAVTIEFKYAILGPVRDFYLRRAKEFGIEIDLVGPIYETKYDIPTSGHAVAFGGGKDSRLISGILDDIGYEHSLYSSMNLKGTNFAVDLDANISQPIGDFSLANRVIIALMSRCNKVYFGLGLGECGLNKPWLQYYDFSPKPLKEFSRLLASLGVDIECIAPLSVLPYNIIQKILVEKYPGLYEGQLSVNPEEKSEKNLHVSLCKAYHGIDFKQHCSEELFRSLLSDFVQKHIENPNDFGFRNYREIFSKEMRCIIYNLREHSLFEGVRELIPSEWGGCWIDYIHSYAYPEIDPKFLAVLTEYAKGIEQCPPEHRYVIPGY